MTKALFETASLGELSLKNRLVRSATWEGIASPEGALPDEAYTIYEELAKGGVASKIFLPSAMPVSNPPTKESPAPVVSTQ